MENNKLYNDEPILSNQTIEVLAKAYSLALKELNTKTKQLEILQDESSQIQQPSLAETNRLLSQILAETKNIYTLMLLNKRVRLS